MRGSGHSGAAKRHHGMRLEQRPRRRYAVGLDLPRRVGPMVDISSHTAASSWSFIGFCSSSRAMHERGQRDGAHPGHPLVALHQPDSVAHERDHVSRVRLDALRDTQRGHGARLGLVWPALDHVAVGEPRLHAELVRVVLSQFEEARRALEALNPVGEVACGEAAATRAEEPPPKRLEGRARQLALPVAVCLDDRLKVRRGGDAALGRLGGPSAAAAGKGKGEGATELPQQQRPLRRPFALEEAVLDLDQLRVLLLRRREAVEQPRACLEGGGGAVVLLQHLQRVPRHVEWRRRHPLEHLAARLCLAVGLEEKRERQQVVPRLAHSHVAFRLHHRSRLHPYLARRMPAAAQLVAARGRAAPARRLGHRLAARSVARAATRAATLAVDVGALLEARRRERVGAVLGEVVARGLEGGRATVQLERRVRFLKPLDHRLHVALEPVELRLPPLEHARRLQHIDLVRRRGSLQQGERLAEAQLGLLDVRLLVLVAQLGAEHELQRGAPPVLAHDGDLRVEGGRPPVFENHER
eukprot:scaffold114268_cov72-Phaeocystis_antarctica.AAC.2